MEENKPVKEEEAIKQGDKPISAPEEQNIAKNVIQREIEDEMQKSFLSYAMAVIVSRALPDVRDGLKPVHRRILFAMHELGLAHNKPFKKSARIVGETLGKFHPHGDTSIYDAMVRMAQDFSLRYPLVQGQGNFGCFTADTKIKLTDGRDLSFIDLIKESKQGKKNYTYTINEEGNIEIAEIKSPRITKENAEIMKVILDNGEEIKCTLNHKFMLRDGNYKEAKDLKPENSLMPLYSKLSTEKDKFKPALRNYQLIYQPMTDKWVPVHNLADTWNLRNSVYTKSAGRIRHHVNFDRSNNNPENIKRIKWKDHWRLHADHASELHKNEDYRKKIAEGRKKFWADPVNKEAYSKRLSERNRENWKNPNYRKKMTAFLSKVNKEYISKHPEKREEFSKRATKTLKKLWKDPKYRELFHNKIVASNKRRKTNLTGKKKFLKICKYLKDNNIPLNKESYERIRKEVFGIKSFTGWDLGIKKYYQNDNNLLLCEINSNHKIIKTEFLKEFTDIYDLTIDKTHNFALASGIFVHNSIDGDSAAAMRYTETRLSKIAESMLEDIEKDTVDFQPNFDGSLKEPTVLPAKLPNLLINGSSGIAVGMATNIPPFNIAEIINAIIELINNPELVSEKLIDFIKGPDFPTGGIIQGDAGIKAAYKYGRGKVIVKAVTSIEEVKDRKRIIVTEIPYMVNKSVLIEQIAGLVKEGVVQGISDLRDESDRKGMRIVIELKKEATTDIVLNQLFKHSRLQTTFGINMLALVGQEPKVLNLKQILQSYIQHRKIVVTRRTKFELRKAEERAHILEGLIIALNNIDDVVKKIKASKSVVEAKNIIITDYSLTPIQAQAILDMRLQKLSSLEQEKIKNEHKELIRLIGELKTILASEQRILDIIKEELMELKEKFSDERRTEIIAGGEPQEIDIEDLIEEKKTVVTVSHLGYVKRLPLTTYKQQKRGGKGIIAAETKEEDFVEDLFICSTHSYLLVFTDKGKIYWLKVYNIPVGSRTAKGKPIINLIDIESNEKITAILPVREFLKDRFLVLATKNGIVKKTSLGFYSRPRKGGIRAITLDEGDYLVSAKQTDGTKNIMLTTKNGMAIKFDEKDCRAIGRTSRGVKGVDLKQDDEVIGMQIARDDMGLLTITENGYGKRTAVSDYRLIGRAGVGVINIKCSERNGKVVSTKSVKDDDELMFISQKGIAIRVSAKDISIIGRNTQGLRIMKLSEGDKVVAAAKIANESTSNNT